MFTMIGKGISDEWTNGLLGEEAKGTAVDCEMAMLKLAEVIALLSGDPIVNGL